MMPMTTKVLCTPTSVGVWKWFISTFESGEPTSAPPPKPMIAMPVARPGRSGNHFTRVLTGAM